LRAVVNAIFYVLVTGCQWRYLPADYPCWQSVYYYFRRWQRDGAWQQIHDRLRSEVRRKANRHKHRGGWLSGFAIGKNNRHAWDSRF
jgi:transposase